MSQNKVYEQFKKHFACYIVQIERWSVCSENSIKIYFTNGRKYIYTITNYGFRFEQVKGD